MRPALSLFVLLWTLPLALFGSDVPTAIVQPITGTVTDGETSDPLIGASVLVVGTSVGTVTDIDGQFSLEATAGDVLLVSYTGYEPQEVKVDGRTTYAITLRTGVSLDEVTVVGSRGKPRTDVERPVPVDVVSLEELASTGQTDLGQMVQFTSPSFNSAKYGVNGTTNYADPATLRGMSPDQSLVLIGGKRRHQFSTINLNVAPGLGTVVTDLNSIPSFATKRIEILRDGAAAQYGSDAIAGIVNLVLQDQVNQGTFQSTAGIMQEGDGITFKNSINYGFDLGKEGSFLNFTLEHFSFSGTNRSDTYTGSLYPEAPEDYDVTGPTPDYPYLTKDPRAERNVYPDSAFVVGNYGSNENETYQAFANASFPITDEVNVYAFGGYSRKDITAYGFFREPANASRAVLEVFPDGYVPILPGSAIDYSTVVGVNRRLTDAWNLDASYSIGHNELEQFNNNSTNPSLGAATPTEFRVGQYNFTQQIADASVSRNLGEVAGLAGLNLAFGAQYRRDGFEVEAGSEGSYAVGPLAAEDGKDIGSSARPGIAPEDVFPLSRSNVGVYADVEIDITDQLLVAPALRYENYSDFGGNLSGKLAARYKLTEQFGVRGSYNRGFRAPSLQQIGNRVNTSTVQNGEIVITKQVSSEDARLAQLGVEEPRAEISNNYNVGLTFEADNGAFLVTVDAFQIDIDDRIVIAERLGTEEYPAVNALFPDASEIRFFTNQISTQTRGIDIVASYVRSFDNDQRVNLSLAGAFNRTRVQDQRPTPPEILAGASAENQDLQLLGQTATELIEVAQPREKILLTTAYTRGRFGATARVSYFGNVQAFSTGLSAEDDNVNCDGSDRCVQTFAAKAVTDLSVNIAFNDDFGLALGSNNLFDVYPDKYNNTRDGFVGQAGSYANGQIPYSRNSNQFGFNGRYYYLTATLNF